MHKYLSNEVLNDEVPDEIKGQFNVAKNMALYSYFFYALAPEVHLKTYTIIEHALRLRVVPKKRMMFKALLNHAVSQRWIKDSGFRHIEDPSSDNAWCKSMVKVMANLRNSQAHGSSMLVGDCLLHISSCADFVNQLFPEHQAIKVKKIGSISPCGLPELIRLLTNSEKSKHENVQKRFWWHQEQYVRLGHSSASNLSDRMLPYNSDTKKEA